MYVWFRITVLAVGFKFLGPFTGLYVLWSGVEGCARLKSAAGLDKYEYHLLQLLDRHVTADIFRAT